jgi:hypothetical protein
MNKWREFLAKWNPLSYCVSTYIGATLSDYASTLANKYLHTPGIIESNPFMRGKDMQFLLWKGCVEDLLLLTILSVVAVGLYKIGSQLHEKMGKVLAALPFLYFTWDRLSDAVLFNIMFALRMHVASQASANALQFLLGGK